MTEDAEAGLTSMDMRATLAKFATGVTVMTADTGTERIATTVSSFNSLSLDPPLILFSIGRNIRAFEAWNSTKYFAVNVLELSQRELSSHFGRPQGDKWAGIDAVPGKATGAPLLPGALASFECETYRIYDGGDHVIIVGKVLSIERDDNPNAQPLVFFGGNYRKLDAETKFKPDPLELFWTYGW